MTVLRSRTGPQAWVLSREMRGNVFHLYKFSSIFILIKMANKIKNVGVFEERFPCKEDKESGGL